MQSKLWATLIVATLFPVAALAASMDANGDGVVTIDEVQAMYPDISVESFSAMDVNADGALDADEVIAAQEAGMLPTG